MQQSNKIKILKPCYHDSNLDENTAYSEKRKNARLYLVTEGLVRVAGVNLTVKTPTNSQLSVRSHIQSCNNPYYSV